jgi:hypothetical protein
MSRAGLMLALLLPACPGVDNVLNTERDAKDDVQIMVVEPGFLDFGGLGTGEAATQTFEIRNEGGVPLEISEIRVEGATGFTIIEGQPGNIGPFESKSVTIQYTPTNLTDTGLVTVVGDDPTNPTDEVDLTGSWLLPVLAVTPDPYEFGAVPFGCLTGKTLMLENIGGDTLVVDSIIMMGDGYSLPAPPVLPLSIEPGERVPLQVLYEVSDTSVQTGQVWVSSNDPSGAKVATQTGYGVEGDCVEIEVPYGETVETELSFTVEAGLVDIAFALDTTSSMSGLALAMASEFRGIVGDLSDVFEDATYGVATYDDYAQSPWGQRGTDLPFILRQQQTSDLGLVQSALSSEVEIHYGDDTPESTMEALYQGLAGTGYDHNCNGEYNSDLDVLPFIAAATDPFGGLGGEQQNPDTLDGGAIGGFGFREGMLPIIIYATDAPLRDADDGDYATPGGCPRDAGMTNVINAATALNARLIGVGVNVMPSDESYRQMETLAEATGSYADLDGDGSAEPAVVTWNGTSAQFRETVVEAVQELVDAMMYEKIELIAADDTLEFVREISPEAFYDVGSGETVTFVVTLEGTLVPQDYEQANQLTFYLVADDTTLLHTYTVTVLTPAL